MNKKTLKILDMNMTKLYNEVNKADVNVTKFNCDKLVYSTCYRLHNDARAEPNIKGGP